MSAVDEQLGRERSGAPLAIAGAVLGAILPMVGVLVSAGVQSDLPKDSASKLLYIHRHSGPLITTAILLGLGALAILLAMRYLFAAVKFRRPELPRVALVCLVFGCLVLAVVQVASQVVLAHKASTFAATGDQTYQEAKHVFNSAELKALAAAGLAGQLALGFSFVMISLNAMRVGLLTRFMGILGVIVGALFVIPLAPGPPVVQTFWLAALAALFAGRWPSGLPPAWTTGKAEPWPTRQQLMEQRDGEPARPPGTPATEPAPTPAGSSRTRSSAKKRKRKKRR